MSVAAGSTVPLLAMLDDSDTTHSGRQHRGGTHIAGCLVVAGLVNAIIQRAPSNASEKLMPCAGITRSHC